MKEKIQGIYMVIGMIILLGLYFVVMLGIGFFVYWQIDINVEGYMFGGC